MCHTQLTSPIAKLTDCFMTKVGTKGEAKGSANKQTAAQREKAIKAALADFVSDMQHQQDGELQAFAQGGGITTQSQVHRHGSLCLS